MGTLDLARRFLALSPADKRYFLRRFVDQKIHARAGFSQFGEDASVASYLRTVGRQCHSYIDIGANDPVVHSNTYMFYRDGGSGVLAEANPAIARRISRKRVRDTVLNVGVVPEGRAALELYVMDMDGLSTLSDERRDHVAAQNLGRHTATIMVPTISINDLLARHAPDSGIDLASIDVEGTDLELVKAWDFDRWRPFLFCVETTVVDAVAFIRDPRFAETMAARGYLPLFETFANTIFVDGRA